MKRRLAAVFAVLAVAAVVAAVAYFASRPEKEKPSKGDTPAPSEKPVTPTEPPESIRTGEITNRTTTESWEDEYLNYLDGKVKETTGASLIDVDGDSEDELVVHADIGSGNLEILTYHNGKVSTLPLNGAGVAFVPGENQMLVAEYEKGTYYFSVYTIKDGTWTKVIGGSYQDPKDGPAVDEEGYGIFENYQWNGKTVSEEEFYTALADAIDVENLEEVTE